MNCGKNLFQSEENLEFSSVTHREKIANTLDINLKSDHQNENINRDNQQYSFDLFNLDKIDTSAYNKNKTMNSGYNPHKENSCMLGDPSVNSNDSDISTNKFMRILDKISENQNKKNKFYSQIYKDYNYSSSGSQAQNENYSNDILSCSNINNVDNTTNIGTLEHL